MVDFCNKKEIELMEKICRKLPKEAKILEIGSFKGRSTNIICDSIKYGNGGTIYCVDPWKGHTGWSKDFKETFSDFVNNTKYNAHMIKTFRMTCEKASKLLLNSFFDMVFIDGDHTRAIEDYDNIKDKIKEGGFLLFHDNKAESVKKAIRQARRENFVLYKKVKTLTVLRK